MSSTIDAPVDRSDWLIFFGPQYTGSSIPDLHLIRSYLLLYPDLSPLRNAIRSLPILCSDLAAHLPQVSEESGTAAANQLKTWLDHGETLDFSQPYANSLRTTLTIIWQLCQFRHFENTNTLGADYETILRHVSSFGVQGHCIGILSAIAVLSAREVKDLGTWATVAARLAFCIGLCVDAQNSMEEFGTFSVRAEGDGLPSFISQMESNFPKAYVSVMIDKQTCTITVPNSQTPDFTKFASSQRLRLGALKMEGRFHHSSNAVTSFQLQAFCSENQSLQFPEPKYIPRLPRSNIDGSFLRADVPLESSAVREILEIRSDWQHVLEKTFENAHRRPTLVLSVGPAHAIPSSFSKVIDTPMQKIEDHVKTVENPGSLTQCLPHGRKAVAIISMGCRFPGADNVEQFWNIIEGGISMAREIPKSRFSDGQNLRPQTGDYRYVGNFLDDVDQFDHKFFGKSSREAQQMDPQQRILLEVAYQTVQDAGWLSTARPIDLKVGCFIGCGSVDYQDNISHYRPSAYSVLGSLRASLCGRVSHLFNWTGPSMTIDTACSSSTVALNQACKAILAGECTSALAGGVHVITSPYLFQNLMAGSFANTSGASRAFDSQANGYSRGEGVGLVLLKDLGQAINDGDHIHGIIESSAVNQGYNDTSINTPNRKSQVELLTQILRDARLTSDDVSYVEAHGTGTQVGDPIEASSIREVYGARMGRPKLHVGAVKSNIGHTEGASGVAGLIKILLMMRHRTIPKQANFETLNPQIPWEDDDGIEISQQSVPWQNQRLVACLNNYGAAGNNAALLVSNAHASTLRKRRLPQYPLIIQGKSTEGILATLRSLGTQISADASLPDLSYNLLMRKNSDLPCMFRMSAQSVLDLQTKMRDNSVEDSVHAVDAPKPVVLTFAGQGNGKRSLSRELYENCHILKDHILRCDREVIKLGLSSMIEPILNQDLQRSLLTEQLSIVIIQYSVAKTWLSCGLRISSMVGHSLGQLTALAVSGSMTIGGCLKLIAARAQLMEERIPVGATSMLSVAASAATVEATLDEFAHTINAPEIACYNGPESVVLAADRQTIAILVDHFSDCDIRTKHLPVDYGFHSRALDSILSDLEDVANSIPYKRPDLPIELCTAKPTDQAIDASFIVSSTRDPVYFYPAIQRLEKKLGPCTWLEIGSATHFAGMVRRSLDSPSGNLFHGAKMSGPAAATEFNDVYLNLVKFSPSLQHPAFYGQSWNDHKWVELPPYQFDRYTHWLPFSPPAQDALQSQHVRRKPDSTELSSDSIYSKTHIDHRNPGFRALVEGHAVQGSPLCPASVYLDIVAKAAMQQAKTSDNIDPTRMIPSWRSLSIHAPLGLDPKLDIALHLKQEISSPSLCTWSFTVTSCSLANTLSETKHASGIFMLAAQQSSLLDSYARLLSFEGALAILNAQDLDAITGKPVYSLMSRVVRYSDCYKSVQRLASHDMFTAGMIQVPTGSLPDGTEIDYLPRLLDGILQVAGIHVNFFCDDLEDNVFIASKIEAFESGGTIQSISNGVKTNRFIVHVKSTNTTAKTATSDIVVFDEETRIHIMAISGVCFHKVKTSVLQRLLSKAGGTADWQASTKGKMQAEAEASPASLDTRGDHLQTTQASEGSGKLIIGATEGPVVNGPGREPQGMSQHKDLESWRSALRPILSEIADVPVSSIKNDTTFIDLGVDSLSLSEFVGEIRSRHGVDVALSELATATDLTDMARKLSEAVFAPVSQTPREGLTRREIQMPEFATSASQPLVEAIPGGAVVDRMIGLVSAVTGVSVELLSGTTSLDNIGMDSLSATELAGDISSSFGIHITGASLSSTRTIADLALLVEPSNAASKSISPSSLHLVEDANSNASFRLPLTKQASSTASTSPHASSLHDSSSYDMASLPDETTATLNLVQSCCADLKNNKSLSPDMQVRYAEYRSLAMSYIMEALQARGCSLPNAVESELLPTPDIDVKHTKLMKRIWDLLEEEGFVHQSRSGPRRTGRSLGIEQPAAAYYEQLKRKFGTDADLQLLHLTGPHIDKVLSGECNPIELLFGSSTSRAILDEFYEKSPLFLPAAQMFQKFVYDYINEMYESRPIRILEIGGGTGGTTKPLMSHLAALGSKFEYTFTDISKSLVVKGSRTFQGYSNMVFRTLDIESGPSADFMGQFDLIFATNAVHATSVLRRSCQNIHKMLAPNGLMVLLELTCGDFYLDAIFGLLEGWWCMKDRRTYALQSEEEWATTLRDCDFHNVQFAAEPVLDNAGLIFAHARPPRMSMQLEEPRAASSVVVQGSANKYVRAIFAFPAGHGTAATYSSLPKLGSGTTVFGLNSPFWKDTVPYDVSLYGLARLYVAEIKRRKPEGPYILLGYSFGGVVAYEAARQMIEANDEVERLVLIDSACPVMFPPYPVSLLKLFDSIDLYQGTKDDTLDESKEQSNIETANSKMYHPHILGNVQALAGYKPVGIPPEKAPQTTLFAAHSGLDGDRKLQRPKLRGGEENVMIWALDNRSDVHNYGFGWHRLVGWANLKIIMTIGSHFSIMKEPNVSSWAAKLREQDWMTSDTAILRSMPVRNGTIQVADLAVISYAALKAGDPNESANLLKAASSDGFFQLDFASSPAEQTVLNNLPLMYRLCEEYFAEPEAVKRRDERVQDASSDRGYKAFHGVQTFEIARDELFREDLSLPDSLDACRSTIKDFSRGLDEACRVMLCSLSTSLGEGDSWESHHNSLRASESGFKFTSGPTVAKASDVGDNQHTDGGTFTVVFGESMGLQTYLPGSKEWAFLPPRAGCALINVADTLERISNGRLHSPRHRITQIEDGAGDRFFLSYLLRASDHVLAQQAAEK